MDLKRFLIVTHRWLGVVLCLLFLLWFASGIGMMYWDFPAVTAADRLERAPTLAASAVAVTPSEAYAALGSTSQPPAGVRLGSFDGRPAYRFRSGRTDSIVYADTGEVQRDVSRAMVDRVAAAWTGLAVADARVGAVTEADQWTVQGPLRALRPLWKFSWPDGQEVYVAQSTGEVVQYTTTASRIGAYLGPIPHWLYFTPLRVRQLAWTRVVVWTSGAGTIAAILGLAIGVWMYSPSRRYRIGGAPTSLPYRGQKRWHAILGLVFGIAATTWAYSGMLSMDPFGDRNRPVPMRLLSSSISLDAFAAKTPKAALDELGDVAVKELEFATFAGTPIYVATLAHGDTRIVPLDGPPRAAIDREQLVAAIAASTRERGGADVDEIDQYDRYYLDRRAAKPLPVLVARVHDRTESRYYIDPKTARVVGSYDSNGWTGRWLYHGLHSLDFPWLYGHRPAWDILVIAFMAGGVALSVTSTVLAWRVVRSVR